MSGLRIGNQTGGFGSGLLLDDPAGFVGNFITIGQAVETDSAQTMNAFRGGGLGVALETDIAQPATHLKTMALASIVTEIDTAQIFTFRFGTQIGIVLEFDTAQPMRPSKLIMALGYEEADTAQPVAVGSPGRTIQQALETDLAQPLTSGKLMGLASPPVETDSALRVTDLRAYTIGLTSEVDTPFAMAVISGTSKIIPVGIVTELDSAFTALAAKALGLASIVTETDTAFSFGFTVAGKQTIPVGIATEVDTAFSAGTSHFLAIGEALEDDLAIAVFWARAVSIGQAIEADSAFPFVYSKKRSYHGALGFGLPPSIGLRRMV